MNNARVKKNYEWKELIAKSEVIFQWCPHVINHHFVKFRVLRTCEIGDITFLICHKKTFDHVINESSDLVCDGPIS